jgi:hypothetical protein
LSDDDDDDNDEESLRARLGARTGKAHTHTHLIDRAQKFTANNRMDRSQQMDTITIGRSSSQPELSDCSRRVCLIDRSIDAFELAERVPGSSLLKGCHGQREKSRNPLLTFARHLEMELYVAEKAMPFDCFDCHLRIMRAHNNDTGRNSSSTTTRVVYTYYLPKRATTSRIYLAKEVDACCCCGTDVTPAAVEEDGE